MRLGLVRSLKEANVNPPAWGRPLTVNGHAALPAFVVVTNHPYHYDLEGPIGAMTVLAGGFKIPDFGLGGRLTTVRQAFETKQKYADSFVLVEAIRNYRIRRRSGRGRVR